MFQTFETVVHFVNTMNLHEPVQKIFHDEFLIVKMVLTKKEKNSCRKMKFFREDNAKKLSKMLKSVFQMYIL